MAHGADFTVHLVLKAGAGLQVSSAQCALHGFQGRRLASRAKVDKVRAVIPWSLPTGCAF